MDAIYRWGPRINHLHLKDVDTQRVRDILAAGGGMPEVWSGGSFVAFGDGDLDLVSVLDAAHASNYDGWVVVEQDVLNAPDVDITDFTAARTRDQKINRDALRPWA